MLIPNQVYIQVSNETRTLHAPPPIVFCDKATMLRHLFTRPQTPLEFDSTKYDIYLSRRSVR